MLDPHGSLSVIVQDGLFVKSIDLEGLLSNRKTMKNSFSINILFLVLTIIGLALLPKLSLQLRPNIEGKSVHVSFEWGNISAEVVEKEVTSLLEGVLTSIKGIKDVKSESRKGNGTISLTFKKGTDMDAARFEVSSLMRGVYKTLPDGVSFPVVSYKKNDVDSDPLLLVYNINGEGSGYQLQKYAESHIAPRLSRFGDVSNIVISGANAPEYEITYNTNSLLAVDLTVADLRKRIRSYLESREMGAAINQSGETLFLTFKGQPADSLKIEDVVLGKRQGRIVLLKDVASLRLKEQKPRRHYRVNGLSTIYMVIYSATGVNQVQLSKDIKEEVAQIREEFPDNFSMMLNHDASQKIEEEITRIGSRAFGAIGILLVFVLAISRRWRYLLIILMSLIVNLSIGVVWIYVLGVEIHLYSLAGITVSLGIIIDNTIIMVDHLRHTGNKKAFLAILAATLTTIGSLTVIFFLKEQQRLNLIDFALVMMVNLAVSLLVALLFIPAIMDKLPLDRVMKKGRFRRKARTFRWSNRYLKFVFFAKRWRWLFIVVVIWGFGIPTFLIPESIKVDDRKGEETNWWIDFFNVTLGNSTYVSEVRPWINKILGGSINFFTSYMDKSNMDWDDQQTRLWVNMTMPDGATLDQMNKVFLEWENFLAGFDEVERFVSNVRGIDRSSIEITFTDEAEDGSFPYLLKQELESRAVETGGVDCAIYGVGRGFNNSLNEGPKSCRIELKGYNYDQLVMHGRSLKDSLLKHPRIKEVIIQTGTSWRGKPKYEFVMKLDPALLAANSSSIRNVYNNLAFYAPGDVKVGYQYLNGELVPIVIREDSESNASIWSFNNNLLRANGDFLRLKNVGTIQKERTGSLIRKKNQQYSLSVEYDFIGPYSLSNRVLEDKLEKLEKELPLGYSASNAKRGNGWWDRKEKTQYWLLFLVVGIIYFICAILLESLIQPLAVIATIPISFIGVFLTFAIFKLKFDQGGYASMILLCGITVNSALYIVNDFNNNLRANPDQWRFKHYLKAFNHKVIPIMLTILSTMLGMVPFLIGGKEEGFWFSLACGAIGGLLFSVPAILVWLPLFMKLKVKGFGL